MDLVVNQINRTVYFGHVQAFDSEDTSGDNNTWIYDRAPDGYKFHLVSAQISVANYPDYNDGIVAIYDGHEYTHWNQWPGVESREILGRLEFNVYQDNGILDLHNWECKEFTIGLRSTNIGNPFRACIVIWYYLTKMTPLERLHYAVVHPKSILGRFPKAFRTTVEPTED